MTVKLLTELHLEFLSFTEGCTGSSENATLLEITCRGLYVHVVQLIVLLKIVDFQEKTSVQNAVKIGILLNFKLYIRSIEYCSQGRSGLPCEFDADLW